MNNQSTDPNQPLQPNVPKPTTGLLNVQDPPTNLVVPLAQNKEQAPLRDAEMIGATPAPMSAFRSRPPVTQAPVASPMLSNLDDVPDQQPERYKPGFEKEHRKGKGCVGGCLGLLFNCRCLFLSFIILVVLIIGGTYLLFTQKPLAIYLPVVDFLNAGLQAQPESTLSINDVTRQLGRQVTGFVVGDNVLTISEEQLQVLLRDRLAESNLKNLNVDLEEGKMKMYWSIDSIQSPQRDLWMVLELGADAQGQPIFYKIGTERIPLPSFLNEIGQQFVNSALKITGRETEAGVIGIIVKLPANVSMKSIKIYDDKMEVVLNIKTGLENIFAE